MSEYKAAFFVIPARILDLEGLTLSFLKIYETIFQFWNHQKQCFLSNHEIMQRTSIQSESTIREAFIFFEKHKELKRKTIKGKRHLCQPSRSIELKDPPVARSTPPRRQIDAPPVAKSTHNNKNINNKNINKSFCKIENEKKHDFAENMNQIARESEVIKENETFKRTPMPEKLRQMCKSLTAYQNRDSSATTRRKSYGYGLNRETGGRKTEGERQAIQDERGRS